MSVGTRQLDHCSHTSDPEVYRAMAMGGRQKCGEAGVIFTREVTDVHAMARPKVCWTSSSPDRSLLEEACRLIASGDYEAFVDAVEARHLKYNAPYQVGPVVVLVTSEQRCGSIPANEFDAEPSQGVMQE